MKTISLLYMSGADIAVPLFETLLRNPLFNVVALLTFPDKAKGRGHNIMESSLKKIARAHNIPIYLHQEEAPTAQIALSFAYGAILPEVFLRKFDYALNVHTSLLPKYRGASPIQAAVLSGDTHTGISLMTMAKSMDTGALWYQEAFPIEQRFAYDIFEEMAQRACHKIPEILKAIVEQKISSQEQGPEASYCHKISKEDGFIHFQENADLIYRKFLAYHPWPGLWSIWNHTRVKWLKIEARSESIKKAYVQDHILYLPCAHGSIAVHELQLESKKAMSIQDFEKAYLSWLDQPFALQTQNPSS